MSRGEIINNCPNCGSNSIDKYCSNCGQRIYRKRFTTKGFFGVVGSAINFERGFLHTAIWMFRNPGTVVSDYLNGKTKIYINPLNYILIIAGAYAFLVLSLNILDSTVASTNSLLQTDQMQTSPEALELQSRWIGFIKKYVNFMPILMIPFASLFSKWYYRKQKLFYGEHLIINTFIFAQNTLITVLFSPVIIAFPSILNIYPVISICFTIIYFTFAFKSIFKNSVLGSVFGTLFVFIGGMIFFLLFMMLIIFVVIISSKLLGVSLMN